MAFVRRLYLLLITLCLVAMQTVADDCPAIVQTALENVDRQCGAIGRNEVCYGNFALQATPNDQITDFHFSEPGDVENIAAVKSLRLSRFDQELGQWGVALMRIQANVPDTLPGQNVTFLMFGDVEITNAGQDDISLTTLEVTAGTALNIRLRPSLEATVLQSANRNAILSANGRLEDGSWLRVRLPEQGRSGWVRADLVTFEGDLETLEIIDPRAPIYGPMQAFYLRTNFSQEVSCAGVPESGILIQSPKSVGRITLSVNDVQVQLGSTAFLQAEPGENLQISVLEGGAQVAAGGVVRFAPAGSQVEIPLNEDLSPAGIPEQPQPYIFQEVNDLPVTNLEQPLEVVPTPLTQDEIDSFTPTVAPSATRTLITPTRTVSPTRFVTTTVTRTAFATTATATPTQFPTPTRFSSPVPTLSHPPSPTPTLPPPPPATWTPTTSPFVPPTLPPPPSPTPTLPPPPPATWTPVVIMPTPTPL